jgi:hypothetical protein
MSFLQEVMASWIGVPVGRYWQISTNFHAYLNTLDKIAPLLSQSAGFTDYELDNVKPFSIVNSDIHTWFRELEMFMSEGSGAMGYTDPFFKRVAIPMLLSWERWKDKGNPDRIEMAIASAENIAATDWQKACIEWLKRRA